MILNEVARKVKIYFYTGEVENTLLFRHDKVTGNFSIINHARALRPHNISQHSQLDVAKDIKKSEKSCIFCKYEEHDIPLASKEKRYEKGEVVIFQNRFPFFEHHYVGILTKQHFVKQFKVEHFKNMFLLFKELIKNEINKEYFYINMNFLPPSGASIVHPHVQAFSLMQPTPRHERIIQGLKKYGKDKWLKEHKAKNLTIGKSKNFTIFATFAPTLNKEVAFVSHKNQRFKELKTSHITEISKIITKTINHYLSENPFNSFNFAIYEHETHGILGFIGLRKPLNKYYSTDRGFLETYHGAQVISVYPEQTVKDINKKFKRI